MNKPSDLPTDDLEPGPSAEELAEVKRRLDRTVMDPQRKAARPWSEVYAELRQKYSDPV